MYKKSFMAVLMAISVTMSPISASTLKEKTQNLTKGAVTTAAKVALVTDQFITHHPYLATLTGVGACVTAQSMGAGKVIAAHPYLAATLGVGAVGFCAFSLLWMYIAAASMQVSK